MPVLAPERESAPAMGGPAPYRAGKWAAPPPPPTAYRRRRGFLGGAARVVAVIAAVLLGWVGIHHIGDLLPGFGNPFHTEQVDRSGPAVLKALDDLHEYRAATGAYQVMVDIEKDARYIPSFIKGERTLFLAQGSVDAGVDFSGLGPGAVTVNPDDHSVTITLPHAALSKPVLDTAASHVVDRNRGLLDRLGSVFSDSPTGEQALYLAAEPKLRAAANESALVAKADENTTQMLTKFLGALGFDTVHVVFQDNPA
ncbi:MAG: hypothetical protein QOJ23_1682 [Actinomycetota bacterium]|nr:hypothetical protein [Actinomycetota bacterium]MDQ1497276.1 hypothetical protein [Actinomycetota bacterium]